MTLPCSRSAPMLPLSLLAVLITVTLPAAHAQTSDPAAAETVGPS